MTAEEYNRLPRFKKEEHLYMHNNTFFEEEIFEVRTLHRTTSYLKVIQNFYNSILVLKECTPTGEIVPYADRVEARIQEVTFLIDEECFWQLVKPSLRRNILASN